MASRENPQDPQSDEMTPAGEERAEIRATKAPKADVVTKEEIVLLSTMLNKAHRAMMPAWETPSWFKLFRHVDQDRSGLISYSEFVTMVRKMLKLTAGKLPEARLRGLWQALDTSGDGSLQSGEVFR